MPPKNASKKQPVIQQPPKQQQPTIPEHQLHGYGRFQYLNGNIYEGNWRLINGVKMKHGEGCLRINPQKSTHHNPTSSMNNQNNPKNQTSKNLPSNFNIPSSSFHSNTPIEQSYTGTFESDKMSGYGQYQYPCGSIYRGQWLQNKHHGQGVYQFANGTIYEGEWRQHLMHGTGCFIDKDGKKWQGEWRFGKFDNKKQKQLIEERKVEQRKQKAIKDVSALMEKMVEVLGKCDKKTFKELFGVFFASGEPIKEQIKEPYCKFDEKTQEKWVDYLNFLKAAPKFNVLSSKSSTIFLGEERVLANQLEGVGQIVEVYKQTEERTSKAAFVNVQENVWVLAVITDEEKKK